MEKQKVIDSIKICPAESMFTKQEVLTLISLVDDTIKVKNNAQPTEEQLDKLMSLIELNPVYIYKRTMPQTQQELISLFDYLGHAAGTQLGTQVYEVAKRIKEPVDTRYVKTKTYEGKVVVYRRAFLDEYFAKSKTDPKWSSTVVV